MKPFPTLSGARRAAALAAACMALAASLPAADAFRRFETDDALHVAVLTGANGTFCAGADLKAIAAGNDRRSSYEQWDLSMADALAYETRVGLLTLQSAETRAGAERFVAGEGRHGA